MPVPTPVLVISPHLDDAVFGCSAAIASHAACTVVTVFGGAPVTYGAITEWDAAAGFTAGDDVIAARRREDARALDVLHARPRWLPFLDAQYAAPPEAGRLAQALAEECERSGARTLFVPLGLFHSDHRLVSDACLRLLGTSSGPVSCHAYEEALYRSIDGMVQRRLVELAARDVVATPFALAPVCDAGRKHRAVRCYMSQLRALRAKAIDGQDIFAPERYWTVHPA